MTKSFYNSFIVSLIFLVTLSVYSEANYYLEMRKVDRKIYVATTQQRMLKERMYAEKRKI